MLLQTTSLSNTTSCHHRSDTSSIKHRHNMNLFWKGWKREGEILILNVQETIRIKYEFYDVVANHESYIKCSGHFHLGAT